MDLKCETENYKTFRRKKYRRKSSGSIARQQVLRFDTKLINSISPKLNFCSTEDPVTRMKRVSTVRGNIYKPHG